MGFHGLRIPMNLENNPEATNKVLFIFSFIYENYSLQKFNLLLLSHPWTLIIKSTIKGITPL